MWNRGKGWFAMHFDFCVVGGGIIGLATALDLLARRPGASLALVEKESTVAAHQTGHNSGVIHSGIYYAPGSLKARLCLEGCAATKAFSRRHNVPFEECGKLIVATRPDELPRMAALVERAAVNGVAVHRLSAEALHAHEPNITGLGAILVPSTGIADYPGICRAMAQELQAQGAQILLGQPVTAITEDGGGVTVTTPQTSLRCGRLVVCGGLQADRLARMAGIDPGVRVVPFKGEYFQLPPDRNDVVRHLIYPVPDPSLPFLGIHLTRMIDGSVTVGPNAVLALAREAYSGRGFDLRDAGSALGWPGLWRLLARHMGSSLAEMRNSVFRRGYLRMCQRYCPSLRMADLLPYRPGIRAQVLSRDGRMVDDFLFRRSGRMLHVLNAPSPAATAAIPIGRMIGGALLDEAGLDKAGRDKAGGA